MCFFKFWSIQSHWGESFCFLFLEFYKTLIMISITAEASVMLRHKHVQCLQIINPLVEWVPALYTHSILMGIKSVNWCLKAAVNNVNVPEPSQTLFNLEKCNTSVTNNRFERQPSGTWTLTVACLTPFSMPQVTAPTMQEGGRILVGNLGAEPWSKCRDRASGLMFFERVSWKIMDRGKPCYPSWTAERGGVNLHNEPLMGIFNL